MNKIMNAVFGTILENLRAIEIVEISTIPVFTKDRTNTGDSKELTVSQFIERYFTLCNHASRAATKLWHIQNHGLAENS